MTWRDAVRIAGPAYAEITFQAVHAVRQGNLPPSETPGALAARARRRVRQSKLLVSGLLAMMALGAWFVLSPRVELFAAPGLDRGVYVTAVVGALLLLDLALVWWTGLQVLPTFLSSRTIPFLTTLPIPRATLHRVAQVLLLRLFDAPALTCLVLTPLAVGAAVGSPLAGLAAVPGVAVVLVVAIALALRTGEFFVRHVEGAPAGPGATALRWAYLLLWAIPAFALYGFLAAAPAFFGYLSDAGPPAFSDPVVAFLTAFPFPLAALPAFAADLMHPPVRVLATLAGALAAYAALGGGVAWWLGNAPLRLGRATPLVTEGRRTDGFALETTGPSRAIVRKDLQVASRVPGLAFVILLPLLDALALGLLTFAGHPAASTANRLAEAAVATSALLATFFGPALFALEVLGYSYVRALPVSDRALILSKVALVLGLFLASAGIVVGFTLARLFAPAPFLAVIGVEVPAVVAAACLEFSLLFRRARRHALPVVNLYTGAWWATLVAVPGLFLAALPLASLSALEAAGNPFAVELAAAVGLGELALTLPLALRGHEGDRP